MRQNTLDQKYRYSLPLPIKKLFRCRIFFETQNGRVPIVYFSLLREKQILTENRDITLLSINNFGTRN